MLNQIKSKANLLINKFDQIVSPNKGKYQQYDLIEFPIDWFDICAILLINYLLIQLLIWLEVKSIKLICQLVNEWFPDGVQ